MKKTHPFLVYFLQTLPSMRITEVKKFKAKVIYIILEHSCCCAVLWTGAALLGQAKWSGILVVVATQAHL